MGWFNSKMQSPAPSGKCTRAALLAAALLGPLQAMALDAPSGLTRLSEEELRQIAAQGLADRLLQRVALYAANELGIEVIGDMASLLNPVGEAFGGLIDADTSFRDAVFNRNNPTIHSSTATAACWCAYLPDRRDQCLEYPRAWFQRQQFWQRDNP